MLQIYILNYIVYILKFDEMYILIFVIWNFGNYKKSAKYHCSLIIVKPAMGRLPQPPQKKKETFCFFFFEGMGVVLANSQQNLSDRRSFMIV